MITQTPLPEDHPILKAWNRYKETDEYANSERWATVPEHTAGSLWSAFVAGFESATTSPSQVDDWLAWAEAGARAMQNELAIGVPNLFANELQARIVEGAIRVLDPVLIARQAVET